MSEDNPIAASDGYIRHKIAQAVAEHTSGLRDAVPEVDDFEMADQILEMLENEVCDEDGVSSRLKAIRQKLWDDVRNTHECSLAPGCPPRCAFDVEEVPDWFDPTKD